MKLSKNSKKIISLLLNTKNDKIDKNNHSFTKNTESIMETLYDNILQSYYYVNDLKHKHKQKQNPRNLIPEMYVKKITNIYDIPKPKNFNSNSFPPEIRKYIDDTTVSQVTYDFSLQERNIMIHFITEEQNTESNIALYTKYVELMHMWLYILNGYASKKCSKKLVIYLYFTSLEKRIPDSNISILDEMHVNSAFTSTCPENAEIVIFRKEEWFKVFIHESFHNFGLDFSDMNDEHCNDQIRKIFKVTTEVNLYESYAETWAEIMNAAFCSFILMKDKKDNDMFMEGAELFISLERKYSFIQMVKTLDFMGLTYKHLYAHNKESILLRNTMYKEKTNVLSYYIIKCILLNNYQGFLGWCKNNNLSLLQFKKTTNNVMDYCKFIERNYKTKDMLEQVEETEKRLAWIKNETSLHKDKDVQFMLTNMRMSACELG